MDFDNRHILDYKYSTNSDGELMIYDYCGNSENLCIPATIGGSPVTQIGPYAFSDNPTIKTVVIPDGVREININAFENCTSLCSVTIPNSVTAIGESAFAGCESLPSVEIPAGVAAIEKETFENCSALSSIVLHEGLERIWWNAFENCTSLVQVVLPDSVEYIGDDAFSGCSGLKNCNIPNGIVYMGYRVFEGCDNLVLSITPGNFREVFAKRYQLPFIPKEDTSSVFCNRSSCGMLRDVLYEIVSGYDNYRQIASDLPHLPVVMREERPFPWKKEGSHWVLHPGEASTFFYFDFPPHYVWLHLKEALLRAIFHPDTPSDARIDLSSCVAIEGDSSAYNPFAYNPFSQMILKEGSAIVRLDEEGPYSHTYWIAVSDSQIAINEQFWYD